MYHDPKNIKAMVERAQAKSLDELLRPLQSVDQTVVLILVNDNDMEQASSKEIPRIAQ